MTDRRNLKKCETCTFYDPIDEAVGRCRLHPPRVIQAVGPDEEPCGQTVWPVLGKDEWCSKFEMVITAQAAMI
jgi:hypothetical protein